MMRAVRGSLERAAIAALPWRSGVIYTWLVECEVCGARVGLCDGVRTHVEACERCAREVAKLDASR